MNIYLQQFYIALIAVYVVGVSGFTQSWRSLIARWLGGTERQLRPLPPFDCEKCATFWACVILAAVRGQLGLPTVAAACGWSLLSYPLAQLMIFIRNTLLRWIRLD